MSTNTISTDVTTGVTLGSGNYGDQLSITSAGTVAPTAYGQTAVYSNVDGAVIVNDGTIIGGPGNASTVGGIGVFLDGGLLTNRGTIEGGAGGGQSGPNGVAGDEGVSLTSGGTLINYGFISGGAGAAAVSGSGGGTGVYLSNATLTNNGTIDGGEGGATGVAVGGEGVVMNGGTLTNDGMIVGGAGITGAGGDGLIMTGGTLTNDGMIVGGVAGVDNTTGAESGSGVVLVGGMITNDLSIDGGAGVAGLTQGGKGGDGVIFVVGSTLTNKGTINGGVGGAGLDAGANGGAGGTGVYLDGGTVTNAGTISGGAGGVAGAGGTDGVAGDAVQFGNQVGTLIVDPGAVFIGNVVADASVADVLVLGGTGVGTLSGFGGQITGFSTIDFSATATWLAAGSAAGFDGGKVINGFTTGDTIALNGFDFNPLDTTYVAGTGLELTGLNGVSITLDIVEGPNVTTGNFTVTDPGGQTDITFIPCFASGTRILTPDGQVPVERIAVGDKVLTVRDGAEAEVIWVGHRTIDLTRHARPEKVRPIRIIAGAFGDGLPERDLRLSPDHALFIDGHLIEAKTLVNGVTVIQETSTRFVTYHHIELAKHDIMLAEGLPAESYLESGNRMMFANEVGPVILHPNFAAVSRVKACAPLVVDGDVVIATRTRLLERAVALGFTTTGAIDLTVRAAGMAIEPMVMDGELLFLLPGGATSVELVSSVGVPAETSAAPGDRRVLGVAVTGIALIASGSRTVISLDDSKHSGFYGMESGHRWTNGAARIILPSYSGRAVLEVTINGQAARWVAAA